MQPLPDLVLTPINFLHLANAVAQTLNIYLIYNHFCTDIGQILNLLTKNDDNKYIHIFYANSEQQTGSVCRICGEGRSEHTVFVQWDFQNKIQRNVRKVVQAGKRAQVDSDSEDDLEQYNYLEVNKKVYKKQQQYLRVQKGMEENMDIDIQSCLICCEQIRDSDQFVKINQEVHHICVGCMKQFLKTQIMNLRVQKLKCPHCQQLLTNQTIKQYTTAQTYQKYLTFCKNLQVHKNPAFKWCPNPKCSIIISTKKSKKSKITCPKCQTEVCTKCNNEAHPKMTCNKAMMRVFKGMQQQIDVQKCPKCKALVQKISGCNHITCKVCKYQWCWLCGSTYSQIHFSSINPMGCAGMQNVIMTNNTKCKIYTFRILMLLCFIILLPILIPLGLVFCGPVAIFNFITNKCDFWNHRALKTVLLAIVCLPIGIALDPFVWIWGIVHFGPELYRGLKQIVDRRRNMIQGSDQSIKRRLLEQDNVDIMPQGRI